MKRVNIKKELARCRVLREQGEYFGVAHRIMDTVVLDARAKEQKQNRAAN